MTECWLPPCQRALALSWEEEDTSPDVQEPLHAFPQLSETLLSGFERGGVRNPELYQGHLPTTTSARLLSHSEQRKEETLRKGELSLKAEQNWHRAWFLHPSQTPHKALSVETLWLNVCFSKQGLPKCLTRASDSYKEPFFATLRVYAIGNYIDFHAFLLKYTKIKVQVS